MWWQTRKDSKVLHHQTHALLSHLILLHDRRFRYSYYDELMYYSRILCLHFLLWCLVTTMYRYYVLVHEHMYYYCNCTIRDWNKLHTSLILYSVCPNV